MPQRTLDFGPWTLDLLFDAKEWLPVFDWLSILDVNLRNLSGCFSLDFIHQLHRLDNANN